MCARMDVEWKFQNMTKDGLAWVGTSNTFASEKDPERLWNGSLHHIENVRTFGTFFLGWSLSLHRHLSWTTMVVWPWKQTLQEMRAEFLSEIWEEFLSELWGEFPSKIWRGNSIIPDMSFRPHLLNDLRSLENNRGMSKVENMFF